MEATAVLERFQGHWFCTCSAGDDPPSGDLGWPLVVMGAFSVAAVNADGDLTQRLQTPVRPVRERILLRPISLSRDFQLP